LRAAAIPFAYWACRPEAFDTADLKAADCRATATCLALTLYPNASSQAFQDSAAGALKRTGCTDAVVGHLQYQRPFWLSASMRICPPFLPGKACFAEQ
jgi:hypothetical protein